MLTTPLAAISLLYSRQGWQPCSLLAKAADILGVDRHGKFAFERISLRATDRVAEAVFIGTARSCGVYSYASPIQDSKGQRREASEIVNDTNIGDLRFEVTSGSHTTIQYLKEARQALWNALSIEAVTKGHDICIRVRQPAGDIPSPPKSKAWFFERLEDRVYATLRRTFLQHAVEDVQLADFFDGMLYVFRNEDGFCEFNRDAALVPMMIADYCTRNQRHFAMQFDSLQHSGVIGVAIDRSGTHAIARGLCACILPTPCQQFDLTWSSPSWSPISGGLILFPKGH